MNKLVSISILLLLLSLAACGRRLPETPIASSSTTTTETTDTSEEASTETEPDAEADTETTSDEAEADTEETGDDAVDEASTSEEANEEDAADEALASEEASEDDTSEGAEDEAITVSGDPENGAALFANVPGNAPCTSCHYVDSEDMLVGPGMLGLGDIAGERVSGQDAAEYLRNSILHPNDYVVDGYPAQVMPQNYGDNLTEEQLNDLVAYMLSL